MKSWRNHRYYISVNVAKLGYKSLPLQNPQLLGQSFCVFAKIACTVASFIFAPFTMVFAHIYSRRRDTNK